jgi:hypothetical protein
MPSKSEKQKRFMTIASHDKEFAEKNKIPQSVAKEFHGADKRAAAKKDLKSSKKEKTHMNNTTRHF